MVSIPALSPFTSPEPSTVAALLLALHAPPASPLLLKVSDDDTHTEPAPLILPAFGSGFTVIDVLALVVQPSLVTV